MKDKVIYLTGANSFYFLNVCALLGSFEESCKDEKIYVCDFGFTEEQRRFFMRKEVLLPRPSGLAKNLHPFCYKGSIYKYSEHLDFNIVVWIDSDSIVVRPLGVFVNQIIAEPGELGEFAAVCPGSLDTIADFIKKFDAKPFKRLMQGSGLSTNEPYLNTGVFILRSKQILLEWARMVFEIEHHVLFEQNLFNYLVYRNLASISLLDRDIWNVHDLSLNELKIRLDPINRKELVYLGGKEVLIIHATSYMGRATEPKLLDLKLGEKLLSGAFRSTKNREIHKLHFGKLVRFLLRNQGLLDECRLLHQKPADQAANLFPPFW